jgi:hypothetical protein
VEPEKQNYQGVEEVLQMKPIEEILDQLDKESKSKEAQVEQRFNELYQWYKVDHKKIS